MKQLLSLALIFCLSAAFQYNPGPSPAPFRIKEIKNLKTGSSTSYTYNADGEILTVHSSLGVSQQYRYEGNLVIKQLNGSEKISSETDTFRLNSRGIAEQENDYNTSAPNEFKLRYDENGFLVESRQFFRGSYGGTAAWVVKDGNQTKYTYTDEKKAILATVQYSYYPDKPNTIGNANLGRAFAGHDSKNLVKETNGFDDKGGTSIVLYDYKFDIKGRVIEKVGKGKSGNLVDSTGYTYY